MTALSLRNVSLSIGDKAILDDVSVSFPAGTVTSVIGPNGAGKTSLLKVAAGLIEPTAGEVFGTDDPGTASPRIAYLPQARSVHWSLTARSIVEIGRIPHAGRWGFRPDDSAAVDHAMALAKCSELAPRAVDTLSGGELARVLLARALAVEAAVLLADEPLAGLDPAFQMATVDTLSDSARDGAAVVVVVHDLNMALRLGGRSVLLHQGRVIKTDAVDAVIPSPEAETVFGVRLERHAADAEQAFVVVRPAQGRAE